MSGLKQLEETLGDDVGHAGDKEFPSGEKETLADRRQFGHSNFRKGDEVDSIVLRVGMWTLFLYQQLSISQIRRTAKLGQP